jgi:hypothetical protein
VLGLRHYQGAAIDLFQGELAAFVCDVKAELKHPYDDAKSLATAYQEQLAQADSQKKRHIAFSQPLKSALSREQMAIVTMTAMKEYFDSERQFRYLKRVSIILSTLAEYSVYQKALFVAFPEVE